MDRSLAADITNHGSHTANYSSIYNESFSTMTVPANRPQNGSQLGGNTQLTALAGDKPATQPSVSGPFHSSHDNLLAADRFIPRTNKNGVKAGGLAEACDAKVNRVLEFNQSAPSVKRPVAAADFFCQYGGAKLNMFAPPGSQTVGAPERQTRKINTKPVKILDAPGLADEFYANILDWSESLDVMALGLGSCVYAWNPQTSQVNVIADLSSGPSGFSDTTVSALKWTDDGCIAIASSNGDVQLWDAEQNTLLRTMRGRCGRVSALSWNDYLLSSGGRDGSVWNHDVRIKQHKVAELSGHNGEVCGVEWRGDGRLLATGGNDNLVNIWDARTSAVPRYQLQQHEAAVKALAWCPWQSSVLATGGGSADKKVKMWNAASGTCTETLDAGAQVTSLHWNSEYKEIVASLGYPTNGITVWGQNPSLKFSKHAEIPNAHDSRILHSTMSADGTTLVTGSADENLKFWNMFEHQKRTGMNNRSLLTMGRV